MFAGLIRRSPCHSPAPSGTKTARLREALESGPMDCGELSDVIGRPQGVIHGLLKHDKNKGRVIWDGARYRINPSYDHAVAEEVKRAHALLMRHGYTVTKPA